MINEARYIDRRVCTHPRDPSVLAALQIDPTVRVKRREPANRKSISAIMKGRTLGTRESQRGWGLTKCRWNSCGTSDTAETTGEDPRKSAAILDTAGLLKHLISLKRRDSWDRMNPPASGLFRNRLKSLPTDPPRVWDCPHVTVY